MSRPNPTTRRGWIPRVASPLPHPSWGRGSEFGEHKLAVATVTAADFWKRLGL